MMAGRDVDVCSTSCWSTFCSMKAASRRDSCARPSRSPSRRSRSSRSTTFPTRFAHYTPFARMSLSFPQRITSLSLSLFEHHKGSRPFEGKWVSGILGVLHHNQKQSPEMVTYTWLSSDHVTKISNMQTFSNCALKHFLKIFVYSYQNSQILPRSILCHDFRSELRLEKIVADLKT